jgi:hypothetical protein
MDRIYEVGARRIDQVFSLPKTDQEYLLTKKVMALFPFLGRNKKALAGSE